ncbi:MAG TPA: phosphoglucomutase (alpha-D-glucose-1,6-bisphosphate-dependent) [Candidatus Dormibacteraeota bacterium]|jgi:phosphoglucomutase|nr:phosphoglucomutase (alpha-D-glucose-1,6-bisphosphate-dependent) [Candidatus Dormibacteraeota bacterium]
MTTNPLAGKPAPPSLLIDPAKLLRAYYEERPDLTDPADRVSFGTSGHRGSSLRRSFNEAHVLAIAQAVCRHRQEAGIDGPLFVGRDTHALSEPAMRTVVEVLAANGVHVRIDARDGYTPTPAVSHAILTHNRGRSRGSADGIVITPSHNPPDDGGIKYNPPTGGPADTDVTGRIQDEANRLLVGGLSEVERIPYERALNSATVLRHDFLHHYVGDLPDVVDVAAIAGSGLHLGVDPLGGSSHDYWHAIADRYKLRLEVVNEVIDPTFRFMTVDHDGKLRMDCSSPYAMARLIGLRDRFDLAFANDPDADRHGIVTRSAGLLDPNHYLAVSIDHLFSGSRGWSRAAVGKTLVSSSLIDRVAAGLELSLIEVPVGFKWFVPGLLDGSLGFGGEESAGASFLRFGGGPWSTDKDGLIMCLLAAEMTAKGKEDPAARLQRLFDRHGHPAYRRVDAHAGAEERAALGTLAPERLEAKELAGSPIRHVLTKAPGNGAPIGGVKVVAETCWFAARPSGTEDVTKVYAESFEGPEHLQRVLDDAQAMIGAALART